MGLWIVLTLSLHVSSSSLTLFGASDSVSYYKSKYL